jgi:hypothetical protein
MQALRRVAAVLTYPLIACLGAGCDRSAPAAPHSPVGPRADVITTADQVTDWLARALQLGELLSDDVRMTAWTDVHEDDDYDPITVVPFEFDPERTRLVRARWLRGTGCPTGATVFIDDPTTPLVFDPKPMPYSDPACTTGDPKDSPGRNEGLLLVKTGPTGNNAASGADLKGLKGITLTELGYDIRKPGLAVDARGSHCGAGAPRFNVVTTDGFFGVGCNSPPATSASNGIGGHWLRLRWGAAGCVPGFRNFTTLECITGSVKSIAIVFDEGDDTGPENIGLAVLDNIDVNGQIVGRGPGN